MADVKSCARCEAPVKNKRSDARYCTDRCRDSARMARYASRHPSRVRAQWRKYFYTPRGTITALLGNARSRANSLSLPFNLTREWLAPRLEIGTCELSGLRFERVSRAKRAGSRAHPFAPSLDRIKPELGYIQGNVRVVCFVVNQARSDFGDDVLFKMAHALVTKEAG